MKKTVRLTLVKTIFTHQVATWSTISAAVKENHDIKNWLTEVRSPLQTLLDDGSVVRGKDTHTERYIWPSKRSKFPIEYLQTIYTTPLERQVLNCICLNQMNTGNGAMPVSAQDTGTWSDMILDGATNEHDVTLKQLPGVVASLSKKRMVCTDGEAIYLTDFGYAYFRQIVWTEVKHED